MAGQCPSQQQLSPGEFKSYNKLAEMMDMYVSLQFFCDSLSAVFAVDRFGRKQHSHFRQTWNLLWSNVSSDSSTPGTARLSAPQMINHGLTFVSHLTLHHDIEEGHIFPRLATRMPTFQMDGIAKQQHREIHKGLDELESYLKQCKWGERELRREEMKQRMETWGEVLWTHLDEEVRELGAENMKKYWRKDEIQDLLF